MLVRIGWISSIQCHSKLPPATKNHQADYLPATYWPYMVNFNLDLYFPGWVGVDGGGWIWVVTFAWLANWNWAWQWHYMLSKQLNALVQEILLLRYLYLKKETFFRGHLTANWFIFFGSVESIRKSVPTKNFGISLLGKFHYEFYHIVWVRISLTN